MPLAIAGIAAGVGLLGDAAGMYGASQANAANEQMNVENINAAMQRQTQAEGFNAQQVQQQEQFQREQQQNVQQYNTQMSDTAMQRRMADLRAAGVNPLLAISQGGASAPMMSPMTGAAASASPASQGSSIPMQNTGAAYGNLGGIMSNATQVAAMNANIDLLKAQTDKTRTESGTEIPAQVNYLKSMAGLNDTNANQAYYNTMRIQEQVYGERLNNDQLRDITMPMAQQNLDVLKATRDALISSRQSEATAQQLGLQGLHNLNAVQQGNFGKIISYLNAILTPVSTAAHAAGAIQ